MSAVLKAPVFVGDVISAYRINDQTGVIHISTFSEYEGVDTLDEFEIAVQRLSEGEFRVNNLILDLSNNGGGKVHFAYYMIEHLFPGSINRFSSNIRLNTFTRQLISRRGGTLDTFGYTKWRTNGVLFRDAAAFIGNNNMEFNQGAVENARIVLHPFTTLGHKPYNNNPIRRRQNNGVNPLPVFPLGNIVVTTNSICLSSCALFVSALKQFNQVPTVTYGGIRGVQKSASSLHGGKKYEMASLIKDINQLSRASRVNAPAAFPTKADFSFTLAQVFSNNNNNGGNTPMEFEFVESDGHLDFRQIANPMDPHGIWTQISQGFDGDNFNLANFRRQQ